MGSGWAASGPVDAGSMDAGAIAMQTAGKHQQHGDGGLVVGAEDPLVGVFPEPIAQDRLHGGEQRHGVHVRAQQDALPLARRASLRGRGAGLARAGCRSRSPPPPRRRPPRTSIPSAPSSAFDQSRAGALVAGGTLGTAELGEDVVQVTALQLVSARWSAHRFSATIRRRSGLAGSPPDLPTDPRPRVAARRRRRTRGTAARGARGGT